MNISENSRSLDEIASLATPTMDANPADPSLLADEVLVSRTRAGDVEAFEQLVGRHQRSSPIATCVTTRTREKSCRTFS